MRLRSLVLILLLWPLSALAAPTVLVLGDSLSAAYGFASDRGWVQLLQDELERQGYPHEVVNASISGETTSGAASRLPQLLERHEPEVVVIGLGGNDGLRGVAPATTEATLSGLIGESRSAGAEVLLLGIQLPPNYGPTFTERFAAIFTRLSEQEEVPLVPFLLEGIATDPQLMQADGIHPTAAAQPLMLELVWPELEPLLAE